MWDMRRNGYKRCWRTVKPREQCLCPFTNSCRTNSDRDKGKLAWSPCYELLTCRYDLCVHCFLAFSFQSLEVKQIPSQSLSPASTRSLFFSCSWAVCFRYINPSCRLIVHIASLLPLGKNLCGSFGSRHKHLSLSKTGYIIEAVLNLFFFFAR